ncbi:hypothetical protein ACS5NO_28005 [Larkinella sp. GY13]|uniref:hypothetical protein n=1 Tax=Larkinella sp. GY13 TaxID=3453720 RepID=UPI003EE9F901
MQTLVFSIKNALSYLLLVVIGLYAGMHFFHEMCPVETQLTPLEYAKYWKIVDGTFMHRRMGVMGPAMIGLFMLNIAFTIRNWKSRHFLLLVLSFLLFVIDVAFTVREQLPINEFINGLDLNHLTNTNLATLKGYQTAAIANFQNRFVFAMLSFGLLGLIPFTTVGVNSGKRY